MVLLRVLARAVGALLMVCLALAGLGLLLFSLDAFIQMGSVRPDRLLQLPAVRDDVGGFLHRMAMPGPTAGLALLCGLAAIVAGILLLTGVLAPRRQRLLVLERDNDEGRLAARPAPLRDMARALATSVSGATAVTRPRLRRGGRLRHSRLTVTAARSRTHDPQQVERDISARLQPLADPFSLRTRVHVRSAEAGERVQ